jgi:hypothetical protein
MAKKWHQVGGDVNPKEYGAILARIEPGGVPWSAGGRSGVSQPSVELVEIDPDEERGGWNVYSASMDESDLTWEKCKDCAASSGISRQAWSKSTIVERAMAKMRHWGAAHLGGDQSHVKNWSSALPAKSNQIQWWTR